MRTDLRLLHYLDPWIWNGRFSPARPAQTHQAGGLGGTAVHRCLSLRGIGYIGYTLPLIHSKPNIILCDDTLPFLPLSIKPTAIIVLHLATLFKKELVIVFASRSCPILKCTWRRTCMLTDALPLFPCYFPVSSYSVSALNVLKCSIVVLNGFLFLYEQFKALSRASFEILKYCRHPVT